MVLRAGDISGGDPSGRYELFAWRGTRGRYEKNEHQRGPMADSLNEEEGIEWHLSCPPPENAWVDEDGDVYYMKCSICHRPVESCVCGRRTPTPTKMPRKI